jgi:hypothetical protein
VVIKRGISDQVSHLVENKIISIDAFEDAGSFFHVDRFLQLRDCGYFSEIDIEGLGTVKNNAPERVFRHCLLKELAVMMVAGNENENVVNYLALSVYDHSPYLWTLRRASDPSAIIKLLQRDAVKA